MDLNSTSFTSDDIVFKTPCDVLQCLAGVLKNGRNGGILFYDYNQSLKGTGGKRLGKGKG